MRRSWLEILLGAVLEVVWVSAMKHIHSVIGTLIIVAIIILSFYLMIDASKNIPAGTTYAVYVGLGSLFVVVAGVLIFHEAFSWVKLIFVVLLTIGVIGLKLVTDYEEKRAH
ncbi:DMT family transporter [Companilactobacillus sp.]|jgi:paired small multidrug resistance pump|uniref:DMT family transporter n=1 Tax=Companilactobacillus sp. TaxID=2767905 RepID=UPI0025C2F676|nr:SMR family transporter [Companilactobacillus sp.]MCH4009302.1 SMR family transporter [Companilactobacillus sp.]MCH4050519.1 SMR family transporter [Companilactobacillus sp.]MCH4077244.1 SMR family transporter [Companilactobacillus sp.]MCH4125820.1 SMR family transporter [Companilactobacillus sp.]MCI1311529.1 SMR family transporter [Companilactobacillus sp.]